jgi:S-adenosyl-L-methionine hydrolase (adenosine-forming)
MIALFTDFGAHDIYVPQMKAVLLQHHPAAVIIDLFHSAPPFRIESSAHLLAALQQPFPKETVFLAVVDPGVGTARAAAILRADDKWYVGPDNGLLSVVAGRARNRSTWRIGWRPPELSVSFHGRDLFAPIAAAIARADFPYDKVQERRALDVVLPASDLREVVHVDNYGNAMTGLRAVALPDTAVLRVGGHRVPHGKVFAEVPPGEPFWYADSVGLVEVAANRASVAALLGIRVGDAIEIVDT